MTVLDTNGRAVDTREPTPLLDTISEYSDALFALEKSELIIDWYQVLRDHYRHAPGDGCPDDGTWGPLLNWAFAQISTWHPDFDPSYTKLTSALVVIEAWGAPGVAWGNFPDDAICPDSLKLVLASRLAQQLEALSIVIASKHIGTATTGAINISMASGDWPELDHFLNQLLSYTSPPFATLAISRCLATIAVDTLIEVANRLNSLVSALTLFTSIPCERVLYIAERCTSKWTRFAAVYVSLFKNGRAALGASSQQSLKNILVDTASDMVEWGKWMKLFNRYPGRYPALQESLGAALAEVDLEAIQAYICAIEFSRSPTFGRDETSKCLVTFARKATVERKTYLWGVAFNAWREWNFRVTEDSPNLFKIATCEIDLAVVAYYLECMEPDKRDQELSQLISEIENIEREWCLDLSDLNSRRNRALSGLQPCAHSTSLTPQDDYEGWVPKAQYEVSPLAHRYYTIRYERFSR